MKTLSIAQLQQNPAEAINEVAAGQTIVLTRHRQPVAKLVPIADGSDLQIMPAPKAGQRPRIRELAHWPRRSDSETGLDPCCWTR